MPLLRRQPFCALPGMLLEYHQPEERAKTLSGEAGIRYRDCCRLAEIEEAVKGGGGGGGNFPGFVFVRMCD